MINRGNSLLKVAFVVDTIIVFVFIALVTMTNLLEIVPIQFCMAGFFVSAIVLPIIIEQIIYGIGRASKQVIKETKEINLQLEDVDDNGTLYMENIDDGVVKLMFFADDGVTVSADKRLVHMEQNAYPKNELTIRRTSVDCKGFWKSLYDTEMIVNYYLKKAAQPNASMPQMDNRGYSTQGYAAPANNQMYNSGYQQ